jgi:hypothetical protein
MITEQRRNGACLCGVSRTPGVPDYSSGDHDLQLVSAGQVPLFSSWRAMTMRWIWLVPS